MDHHPPGESGGEWGTQCEQWVAVCVVRSGLCGATSGKQLGKYKMIVPCLQGMRHTLLPLAAAHGTSPLGVPVQSYTHLQFDCAVVGSSMPACCVC